MCNDASTTYTDDKDLTYLKNINVKQVFSFDGSGHLCLYFAATKRIKKGEELLYSYGNGYWKTKYVRDASPEDQDHSVKAYFKYISDDVIDKLNGRIAKSTSMMNTENLKMEKSFVTGLQMAYDTEGVGLDDYISRYIITKCLLEYQKNNLKISR